MLRRVAQSVEGLGQIEVLDITFTTEITPEGVWPSMTVYFDDARGAES